MRNKIRDIFGQSGDVLREYSVVLIVAFFAAVCFMAASKTGINDFQNSFVFFKAALTASLGISLLFGLKMLAQRRKKTILFEILGLLFLLFFYNLLPENEEDFTERFAFLIIPTFILSHLLVSFIPFIGKNNELNFWQYNKNLFLNIFMTAVFTGVLTGGVELAILAVDKLFDFNFEGHYYLDTFLLISVLGSCFIFLLFNGKGLEHLERDGNYPQVLKFFTQFVLIPLLIIYAVILYFYAVKILIKWELPRGWVSYLVLAYSLIGILALLLVHPLKNKGAKSWVKIFSRIFFFTLIPLLILLFIAIFTRVLEYGYTESRYFVLLLAIWLSFIVLYFSINKTGTIKIIPVSLFAVGLFSLITPYFNSFSVAKRSQKTELKNILSRNNLLESGKINFNKPIQDSVAKEISNKFTFLKSRNELSYLKGFIKSDELKNISFFRDKKIRYSLEDEFKNVITSTKITGADDFAQINLQVKDFKYNIQDYNYLFKAYNYRKNEFEFENNKLIVAFSPSNLVSEFQISFNGKKININPELQKIVSRYQSRERTVYLDDISVTKTVDGYEFKFILDGINYSKNARQRSKLFINNESVLILIKKNQ